MDINEQVKDILARAGITFQVKHLGLDTPKHMNGGHPMFRWCAAFMGGGRVKTVSYWTGTGLRDMETKSPIWPTEADIVECVLREYEMARDNSFEDWCYELGWSSDSIKASKMYQKSLENGEELREVLGLPAWEELSELDWFDY